MDSRFASWNVALVALGLSVVGCGGDDAPADPDAGASSLPVLSTGTQLNPATGAADYACNGTATQPASGADVGTLFQLRDFESDAAVGNTRVWLFRDNVVRDACSAPGCVEFMTNADGDATVSLPADGWYAYRVFPREGATAATTVIDSMQYNEPAPAAADSAVTGNAVSAGTLGLIPAVLDIVRTPGTALLAGTVVDCAGTPVYGAEIRAYSGSTRIEDGQQPSDPHFHYFDGDSFPSEQGTHTHADGLYVAIHIPLPAATDDVLRIEAWGRPSEGPPVRIGCEAVRVLADAVTIVNLGPERSDYGAGHPCAAE
ncbi:hypothetical protein [Sandaracinus amylolyticus]|uniref:hypothetical protein n=1 Tax=Sandaracinus amylolyticus TaxID=927083 RepID=UPI001F15DD12|nr:hypothetical protein [Sandaracinus amylolyticus]UJR81850.1 Hypothetical protein I5071_39150 [Sandaracinus amylolyticus]